MKMRKWIISLVICFCFATFFGITILSIYEIKDAFKPKFVGTGSEIFRYTEVNYSENKTQRGVVSFPSAFIQESDFVHFTNENGMEVLISKFETEEFVCSGSCFCEEQDDHHEKRRSSISKSNLFSKSLKTLVASFSSVIAYQKAKDYFVEECETDTTFNCPLTTTVTSEIESCEPLISTQDNILDDDEIDEKVSPFDEKRSQVKNSKHVSYVCTGRCRPRMTLGEKNLEKIEEELEKINHCKDLILKKTYTGMYHRKAYIDFNADLGKFCKEAYTVRTLPPSSNDFPSQYSVSPLCKIKENSVKCLGEYSVRDRYQYYCKGKCGDKKIRMNPGDLLEEHSVECSQLTIEGQVEMEYKELDRVTVNFKDMMDGRSRVSRSMNTYAKNMFRKNFLTTFCREESQVAKFFEKGGIWKKVSLCVAGQRRNIKCYRTDPNVIISRNRKVENKMIMS